MAEETTTPDSGERVQKPNKDFSSALLSLSGLVVNDASEELEEDTRLRFNVVGIGASAGGVEACIEFFGHLPAGTGMAYIVVLHLSADQKSHLTEILARHTSMPVVTIQSGTFYLEEPNSPSAQRPIDFFLYSLATDQKSRAIGIIFSGMDSDGALGLRAIKGESGITIVQSPESAQHGEMPRSMEADHVDIVSSPGQIAAQLTELARQFQQTNLRLLHAGDPEGEEHHFMRVLALMRIVSGVDFRHYKPTTIRRRIARRMLLHRIGTLREYVALLQTSPKELREL